MHGPITHGSSAALSPRALSVPPYRAGGAGSRSWRCSCFCRALPVLRTGHGELMGCRGHPGSCVLLQWVGEEAAGRTAGSQRRAGGMASPKPRATAANEGQNHALFRRRFSLRSETGRGGVLPSKTTRTLNASLCPQQRCVLKIAVRERAEGCAPCSSAMAAAKPRSCFPSPPSPPRSLLAALCRRETPQDRLQQQQRLGGMGRAALGAALGVWELEEGEGRAVRSPDCGSDRTACQCAAHAFFMRTCRWALRTAPEQRGAGRAALMGAANRAKVGGSPACVSPPYALVSLCSCPVPSRSAHPVWECKTVGGKLYLCPSAFPCPNAWLCCRLPAVQPWPKKKEKKAKKKKKKDSSCPKDLS